MYDYHHLLYTGTYGEGQTGEAYHKPDYLARQTVFPQSVDTESSSMSCDFLMEIYAAERTKTLAFAVNCARSSSVLGALRLISADPARSNG
jgi:hypothetical protein